MLFYKIVVDLDDKKEPVLAYDLIGFMRKKLDLDNQILIAIYGIDLRLDQKAKRNAISLMMELQLDKRPTARYQRDLRGKAPKNIFKQIIDSKSDKPEEDPAEIRNRALNAVKTFKTIKQAIW